MLQRRIEARHRTQLEACAVGPGKGRSSLAVGEHPLSEVSHLARVRVMVRARAIGLG